MFDRTSDVARIGDGIEPSGRYVSGFGLSHLYRKLGKRLFDIGFSALALLFLAPVIGIFALLVRRDGGPAFYSHDRIGKDGKTFRCYKIRSMVADADARLEEYLKSNPEQAAIWDVSQKLEQDPRITALGDFLRRSSLDELPQFLNVLKGDMSVVGPRPFMPDQEDKYRAAGGKAYYRLRPGVTGLWQVGSRNRSAFVDRVGYDEAYDENLSLFSDLRLIVATVAVILRRTGV